MRYIEIDHATMIDFLGNMETHYLPPNGYYRFDEIGDIFVREKTQWRLIGGMLGGKDLWEPRLIEASGLEWA